MTCMECGGSRGCDECGGYGTTEGSGRICIECEGSGVCRHCTGLVDLSTEPVPNTSWGF